MKSFRERLLSDYNKKYDRDGISGMRMAERLHTLSKIGETETGVVTGLDFLMRNGKQRNKLPNG